VRTIGHEELKHRIVHRRPPFTERLIHEEMGPRRSEYEAFSRQLGLKTQRAYLQHTPQGDQAIIYLEGDDLQRTFHELQMSQDPFAVWLRQRTKDLFDGIDLAQTDLRSLSQYVLRGPALKRMKRVIAPGKGWSNSG